MTMLPVALSAPRVPTCVCNEIGPVPMPVEADSCRVGAVMMSLKAASVIAPNEVSVSVPVEDRLLAIVRSPPAVIAVVVPEFAETVSVSTCRSC